MTAMKVTPLGNRSFGMFQDLKLIVLEIKIANGMAWFYCWYLRIIVHGLQAALQENVIPEGRDRSETTTMYCTVISTISMLWVSSSYPPKITVVKEVHPKKE